MNQNLAPLGRPLTAPEIQARNRAMSKYIKEKWCCGVSAGASAVDSNVAVVRVWCKKEFQGKVTLPESDEGVPLEIFYVEPFFFLSKSPAGRSI